MNINNNFPDFNFRALGIDEIPSGSSQSASSRSGSLNFTITELFEVQLEMNRFTAVEERSNPNNQ